MNVQADLFAEDTKRPDGFSTVTPDDVPDIVALGRGFYAESELSDLTPFSPERLSRSILIGLKGDFMHGVMFHAKGVPAGFALYTLDSSYTEDPLAYIWLLYVVPHLRASPAGRLMLGLIEKNCTALGAVALYGGSMAGIDAVRNTLPNLYRKMGFDTLYWGRKALRKEDET